MSMWPWVAGARKGSGRAEAPVLKSHTQKQLSSRQDAIRLCWEHSLSNCPHLPSVFEYNLWGTGNKVKKKKSWVGGTRQGQIWVWENVLTVIILMCS